MGSRSPWADYVRPGFVPGATGSTHVPERSIVMIEGPRPWGRSWVGPKADEPSGTLWVDDFPFARSCPLCRNAIDPGSDLYCPQCDASGYERQLDNQYQEDIREAWRAVQREKEQEEARKRTLAERRYGDAKPA